MKTKLIEVETSNKILWGKFMVGIFDTEWSRKALVPDSPMPLLARLGWGNDHFLVVDLSVGHGAVFHRFGDVEIDVDDTGIYF